MYVIFIVFINPFEAKILKEMKLRSNKRIFIVNENCNLRNTGVIDSTAYCQAKLTRNTKPLIPMLNPIDNYAC